MGSVFTSGAAGSAVFAAASAGAGPGTWACTGFLPPSSQPHSNAVRKKQSPPLRRTNRPMAFCGILLWYVARCTRVNEYSTRGVAHRAPPPHRTTVLAWGLPAARVDGSDPSTCWKKLGRSNRVDGGSRMPRDGEREGFEFRVVGLTRRPEMAVPGHVYLKRT